MTDGEMRKLMATGFDARGRCYKLYDYGADRYAPKTINEHLNNKSFRYWCFYEGRTFLCTNDVDKAIKDMRDATENSRYYGSTGSFEMIARYRRQERRMK